jgi:O-acetyl-ADP-ribose deacetylase (regulator of RNase III)
MPINNVIEGDLVKLAACGMFDVIVHGCNCFNTMKSGIAKTLVAAFPVVAFEDSKTERGARTKLGTYSSAYVSNFDLEIINAYTQYLYGTDKVQVEYKAVQSVFIALNKKYKDLGVHIGIPKIGCGLAGGEWDVVEHIINTVTPDLNITLVEFENGEPDLDYRRSNTVEANVVKYREAYSFANERAYI